MFLLRQLKSLWISEAGSLKEFDLIECGCLFVCAIERRSVVELKKDSLRAYVRTRAALRALEGYCAFA